VGPETPRDAPDDAEASFMFRPMRRPVRICAGLVACNGMWAGGPFMMIENLTFAELTDEPSGVTGGTAVVTTGSLPSGGHDAQRSA